MSPARLKPFSERTSKTTDLLLARLAERVREERRRRGWSVAQVGREAGISRSAAAELEMGGRASIDRWVAVGLALGLELEMSFGDPTRRGRSSVGPEDPVHAAMGELELAHLGRYAIPAAVEEPYQHFQFAGRADVVGWTLDPPALFHIENRTRFPTVGDVAGSWNAKRRWLGADVAKRLGIPGFTSETHVMVCLWSAEVLRELRRRPATFRSLGPDPADRFESWWAGRAPGQGRSSSLVVLDPFATGRQRQWLDLGSALTTARPRVRGYAEAAERLVGR
jgi:transcriptional regulator with XRE-family HTH domain